MAYMHIGKDFTPPDVPGKVTGRIKYAEDYTREDNYHGIYAYWKRFHTT